MAAMEYAPLIDPALDEARAGLAEGGLPIGSVLCDASGAVVSRGRNMRVQTGDPHRPRRDRLPPQRGASPRLANADAG